MKISLPYVAGITLILVLSHAFLGYFNVEVTDSHSLIQYIPIVSVGVVFMTMLNLTFNYFAPLYYNNGERETIYHTHVGTLLKDSYTTPFFESVVIENIHKQIQNTTCTIKQTEDHHYQLTDWKRKTPLLSSTSLRFSRDDTVTNMDIYTVHLANNYVSIFKLLLAVITVSLSFYTSVLALVGMFAIHIYSVVQGYALRWQLRTNLDEYHDILDKATDVYELSNHESRDTTVWGQFQ
ncbi:hypothetical protein [Candidatus Xianfuyuplasma coldseepsis]|uniref:Uncharacterized protein n=1 Tax=Candidatus Xianfuyuplasma coldseepsis TaxID=2782163 RepID=A0A7L7KRN7_9MOLU|nr:hypothetical protein [Xianfuyuplasma coldseepsis]QMS85367.1 hypothetical protein G4Z02_06245 [Xianfuyuplasma coldseepsis]